MAFDVGTAVGYLDLDTSGFKKGFKTALDDLETFSNKSNSMGDRVYALGSAFQSAGSSMTKYVTTPLLGVGAAAVTVSAGFESAMSEVQAISGATGKDFEDLTAKAQEMGAKTKFSASESAEAMQYMAMAGWKTEEMLSGIEGIMNLAAASGEDLATTSDIVTDALTAFGLSAGDAGKFADVLAAASSNANTNVYMLGESFKYVAPVAGALGYSAEDTAIALGLMANAGIKGSQGGTALRSSLSKLVKPTKDAAEVMEQYGLSLTNSDGSMKSLGEVMGMLRDRMGDLSEAEQAQAAATLFGQEAMSGMLAIINASDGDYEKLTNAIYSSQDAAVNMAETMQDNLGGQLTILKSTVEGIAISFGNILLPVVKKVVESVQGFATWLNNLSESQKTLIVGIAGVVAAIGPLLLAGGKILKFVGSWPKLVETFKAASTVMSGAFSGMLAPIAAIVAAVIALKIAWDNNLGGIQEKTAELWAHTQEVFNALVEFIRWFCEFVTELWESNWMGIQDIFNAFVEVFSTLLSGLLDGALEMFEFWKNIFTGNWEGAWENVKNIFKIAWDTIIKVLGTVIDIIVDTIIRAGVWLWEAAVDAFNWIIEGAQEVWDDLTEWFSKAIEDPVGTVLGIGESLYEAGADIFNSLWDGLSDVWDSIVDWVGDAISWIKEKVSFWNSEKSKMSSDKSSISRSSSGGGGNKNTVNGSYASGLDYVPRDMLVRVHEGESIRTKQQTKHDFATKSTRETPKQPVQLILQVDGRTLGHVAIDNINDITDTSGKVPLKI